MFGIKKLLAHLTRTEGQPSANDSQSKLPTVKFDETKLSPTVKAQLKKDITTSELIGKKNAPYIYSIALEALRSGRDAHHLYTGLMRIEGMQKGSAHRITRFLLNRASALMNIESSLSLGLTEAIWVYSKAPCMYDCKRPSEADLQQDADHRALDGKKFDIRTGVKVGETYIWPGSKEGCRCSSRSVLPF